MKRRLIATLTVALVLAGATALETSPVNAASDAGAQTVGQRIINADGDTAGKCLDYEGGGSIPWTQMWGCNGYLWQDWSYTHWGNNRWTIESKYNGRCLIAQGHANRVGVYGCLIVGDPSTSQIMWIRHDYPNGWVQWESARYREQCMDVQDYGTSRIVQLWHCLNQGNQRWRMQ